ncbi:hypothetical protein D8M04_17790 [Oceanobacillus piezotolerans]|uniref:Uncharacterized protein n=1 Tax=Oceanobacillus piezotolerans TaxID=2448030 RepID=A0A498DDQ0_9BACI|nr:hypothetical protein [Oceanobacillus piezotolerans]RLL41097.1 hypothetical protein D8M04_17790 [Oceanobacillus piezotolerans]
MANRTIQELIAGEQNIVNYYIEANGLWEDIWRNEQSETVEGLSRLLFEEQMTFESQCGGRFLGQEIMAWSGFAHLYDIHTGFEGINQERVNRLREAFKMSSCSLEVIAHADKAAESYHLE